MPGLINDRYGNDETNCVVGLFLCMGCIGLMALLASLLIEDSNEIVQTSLMAITILSWTCSFFIVWSVLRAVEGLGR